MMMGGWGKSMYAVDKTIKKIIIILKCQKGYQNHMKRITRDKFEDSNIYLLLLGLLIAARHHSASPAVIGLYHYQDNLLLHLCTFFILLAGLLGALSGKGSLYNSQHAPDPELGTWFQLKKVKLFMLNRTGLIAIF